jgi:tellurite resistance protein TehA-like permease
MQTSSLVGELPDNLCFETVRSIRKITVKHLSPAYFALVMATGIVSIAAWDFGLPVLAAGLFAFNLVAYVIVACLTAARLICYPQLFFADMTDHRLGPGFFTAVAATCIVGTQFLLLSGSLATATAFLALGIALWMGLTYTIFAALTVKGEKPALQQALTGAWLIAVVATQSIAVLAVLVAGEWPQPFRLELNFFALSMWLWGGMLYIWIISLIFYRQTFLPFSPGDLTPPYWINMGAMAISTLAGAGLVHNAPDAPFLTSMLPFIKGFTILWWATGTWWIPMLIALEVWQHLIRRFPLRYDPLRWGAVFPLGMYAVATKHLAAALALSFLTPLASAFFVAALAAWTLVFAGLAWGLWTRFARGWLGRSDDHGPSEA